MPQAASSPISANILFPLTLTVFIASLFESPRICLGNYEKVILPLFRFRGGKLFRIFPDAAPFFLAQTGKFFNFRCFTVLYNKRKQNAIS